MIGAREAYRLWAPTYAEETAVSLLDRELAASLSPATAGRRLLDAGCGTGRRLPDDAALAVGIDLSPEMLAAGGRYDVAAADIGALPFANAVFDLVWCRLVLGHVAGVPRAYGELARVLRAGGHLLVTDFHADAAAAGHRRSFRDQAGVVHDVEHHVHDHEKLARGFSLIGRRDGAVGPALLPLYRRAGREARYHQDLGLKLVAGFLFQRCG
jgi:malonyl-CoA O-methyltransferase